MADTLDQYNRKRHFSETDEPPGDKSPQRPKRLRFVVQHHLASRDHYDFRLEWDGVLKSWAVPKGPSFDPHDKRLAVEVEDHPLDYRTFEGTIPKGQYGGGVVMIWDQGHWLPLEDPGQGLAQGSLKFNLEGERLKGKWALVRMKPKPGEKNINWLLIKERDGLENSADIHEYQTSVTSGRSMEEIEQGREQASEGASDHISETATTRESEGSTGSKNGPASGRKAKAASFAQENMAQGDRSPASVTITNPDKIVYPGAGVSKGDVAAYYRKVAARMLPYLENRVLSAVRCPGGIETACFYKKHPNDNRGVMPVSIPVSGGKSEEYFFIPDAYGLLYEVQMNTLEFHTWGSRVDSLEEPDLMVFDLDPDEGLDLERIRQGVRDLKSLLEELSLISYLKTSGGKGYHVVIPFGPGASWEKFREFARNTAITMEALWPERYTSNVRKIRRNDRIFVDWIRNGRGATSVAPYSLRAREGAPVSMPIGWKELESVTPDGITLDGAVKRLRRKDPWAGFFEQEQRLK